MLNRVCSPEMSFENDETENEPHAYVAYWEGEKESVPLKFVFEFPPLWRTKGWDDNKLYKVFWSPDEDDSPTEMLKRVPEIPVHEKGSSLEKPGYYRAAVVKVKESLKELEEAIASKRQSVGLMRYKYASFEERSDQQTRDRSKKKAKTTKVKKSRKNTSKANSGSRRKGLNVPAQIGNTDELKNDLSSRFPHLVPNNEENADEVNSFQCVQSGAPEQHIIVTNGTDEINLASSHPSVQIEQDPDKDKCDSKQQATSNEPSPSQTAEAIVQSPSAETCLTVAVEKSTSVKTPKSVSVSDQESSSLPTTESCSNDEDDKKCFKSNSESDLVGPKQITPGSKVRASWTSSSKRKSSSKKRRRSISSTSSPSSDSDGHGKKFKYDVDFTPRKYVLLKDEVAILKNTIQRIMNLNLKLQEDKNKLEGKIHDLECTIERLNEKKVFLPTNSQHKPSFGLLKSVGSSATPSTQQSLFSSKPICIMSKPTEPMVKRQLNFKVKDQIKLEPDADGDTWLNYDYEDQDVVDPSAMCETIISENTSKDAEVEGQVKPDPDGLKSEGSAVDNLKATSDGNGVKQENRANSDQTVDVKIEKPADNGNDNEKERPEASELDLQKDLVEICGAKIPKRIKEAICSLPEGEKRDLRFIKDLSTAVFGPEVLASHSISGTSKGGKKQPAGSQPKVKRAALCKDTLKALRNELIKRVEKEEKKKIEEPDTHKRTTKRRFHDAIFDVQKKLRGWGYGTGEKPNTLTEHIFK